MTCYANGWLAIRPRPVWWLEPISKFPWHASASKLTHTQNRPNKQKSKREKTINFHLHTSQNSKGKSVKKWRNFPCQPYGFLRRYFGQEEEEDGHKFIFLPRVPSMVDEYKHARRTHFSNQYWFRFFSSRYNFFTVIIVPARIKHFGSMLVCFVSVESLLLMFDPFTVLLVTEFYLALLCGLWTDWIYYHNKKKEEC